ncbi:MAG: N-acetylmuramoyl-L-alanine amidase [Mariniphaga sp.]
MYKVKFYKGEYMDRQLAANADGAVAYIEHHFNSSASATSGYSVAIVGSNASQTSRNWGIWYASAISEEFATQMGGEKGIVVGGYGGRGDNNIKYTAMPAILLEPLFASNPDQAEIIRSENGRERLAKVLADSIRQYFPRGGLIAFSVGHKYKTSSPNDRGAAVVGGGYEADYAELVLLKVQSLLTGIKP